MGSVLREPSHLRHGALTVLHEFHPGPLTAIAVAIRAGSRCDGAYPGIAHMTEHMLFQGTRKLDQAHLNRRAGELGGEHDADTGYEDMTLHFEVFNEDVDDALALLAAQLFDSTVPADRLAKERRVVVDEIRGRLEDPANYLHEHAWGRFFGGPLGHPVCGTIASVRRMTRTAVRNFAARHFVPRNMVLGVVGGIPRGALMRSVARAFPRGGPKPRPLPGLGRRRARGFIRLRRRDLTQAYLVRLMQTSPEPRRAFALGLALEIVGADPDARLFQEIRERLGLGYDLGASVELGAGWAVAIVSASSSRDDERRLVDTVDRTCEEARKGFSTDELSRARKKIRYRFARVATSPLDRAVSHATRAANGQLSLARAARMIPRITLAEVDTAWRDALEGPTLTAVLSD